MWNYKIAMATLQYVLVSRWRRSFKDAVNEDVRAQKDALENLNTEENIKKDSNRYFAEKVWQLLNFISQISGLNIWESGVLDRYDPG